MLTNAFPSFLLMKTKHGLLFGNQHGVNTICSFIAHLFTKEKLFFALFLCGICIITFYDMYASLLSIILEVLSQLDCFYLPFVFVNKVRSIYAIIVSFA